MFFNIDYELGVIPANQGLFHAEFRRIHDLQPQLLVGNTHGEDNYVILDARGRRIAQAAQSWARWCRSCRWPNT